MWSQVLFVCHMCGILPKRLNAEQNKHWCRDQHAAQAFAFVLDVEQEQLSKILANFSTLLCAEVAYSCVG